jgi:hypothetical protein
LPATLRDAVDAEITVAFNADGAIGVSTAPAPTRVLCAGSFEVSSNFRAIWK